MATWQTITEMDQVLVPTSTGYKSFSLVELMGFDACSLTSVRNFGTSPLHFITQRGPFQDGETPLDMRWDTRNVQIVIAKKLQSRTDFFDTRYELVDLLRPNRSFGTTSGTQPLIYRKWLPGGKVARGIDLVTAAGSATVTSDRGRFVHNGLTPGMGFEITSGADTGTYQVVSVPNDFTIVLDSALAATATGVHWRYVRGSSYRDLFCLMSRGPQFDEGGGDFWVPAGYQEAIRFIAHDPFWYGQEQTQSWDIGTGIGDLIFDYLNPEPIDTAGAWFGEVAGEGRWLFEEDFVGRQIGVIYWGHEVAFPTIEVNGPAEDISITNGTTGSQILLEVTLVLGESVTIDVANLSVVDNTGANLFPFLTGDLATFSLSPEPQAPNRQNSISISYSEASSDSSALLKWRNKYVSL